MIIAEYLELFTDCSTIEETNRIYKQNVEALMEAHRQIMATLVGRRDDTTPKRTPQNEAQIALVATQRSHDTLIRQWATSQGIPFQRVSKTLRAQYDAAHA